MCIGDDEKKNDDIEIVITEIDYDNRGGESKMEKNSKDKDNEDYEEKLVILENDSKKVEPLQSVHEESTKDDDTYSFGGNNEDLDIKTQADKKKGKKSTSQKLMKRIEELSTPYSNPPLLLSLECGSDAVWRLMLLVNDIQKTQDNGYTRILFKRESSSMEEVIESCYNFLEDDKKVLNTVEEIGDYLYRIPVSTLNTILSKKLDISKYEGEKLSQEIVFLANKLPLSPITPTLMIEDSSKVALIASTANSEELKAERDALEKKAIELNTWEEVLKKNSSNKKSSNFFPVLTIFVFGVSMFLSYLAVNYNNKQWKKAYMDNNAVHEDAESPREKEYSDTDKKNIYDRDSQVYSLKSRHIADNKYSNSLRKEDIVGHLMPQSQSQYSERKERTMPENRRETLPLVKDKEDSNEIKTLDTKMAVVKDKPIMDVVIYPRDYLESAATMVEAKVEEPKKKPVVTATEDENTSEDDDIYRNYN